MNDEKIIDLFFARDENAIKATEEKYTTLCHYVAKNYLSSREDREECLNDALLALWNAIPPAKPKSLSAFLSATVRRIAISKSRASNAWKRGGHVHIVSDEFLSTIADGTDLAEEFEARRAGEIMNRCIGKLSKDDRRIFVMRYWLSMSYEQIRTQTGFGESKIKMSLLRTRAKLAEELRREGFTV
ncbi:MAG: sigma-70 family RNA polymerase sigma factor [Clostridia bacterium]|nr:sigma-70 family RNA polymerase sigma factor [Clostridia bacterium]